jgi:hypothetical protein
MAGYFQVDRGIFTSSIWITGTPEERVLWLWLLGNKDDDGVVRHRELAIADGAKLARKEVADALGRFSEPDPDSRTGDNEGRRIALTDEGFVRILNHELYHTKDYSTPRWRKWKDRQRPNALANADQHTNTVGNEEQGKEQTTDLASRDAVGVLNYWQERTKTKIRSSKAHQQILTRIKARLRDGCSVDDLKACVDFGLTDEFYVSKGYAKKPDVLWRNAERVSDLANSQEEKRYAKGVPARHGPTPEELAALDAESDR